MDKKQQVVVIHGGHALDTKEDFIERLVTKEVTINDFKPKKDWKDILQSKLGEEYDVLSPRMPNRENAKYAEWKIWFEKLVPYLNDNVILVGHSLGGLFLVKYLSDNKLPMRVKALLIVAAPFEGKDQKYIRNDNFLFKLELSGVTSQVKDIIMFHSKDDRVVPFSDLEKYLEKLPEAESRTFENRGHFNAEDFPEIIEDIKLISEN